MGRNRRSTRIARTAQRASTADGATVDYALNDLYARPGFLFRRAHQIAVGIFVRDCGALGLTAPQHSALVVISRLPGLDQTTLAKAIGFDRATVGQLLRGLEQRRLVLRQAFATDARRKRIVITPDGMRILDHAASLARMTSDRLLAPLSPSERRTFLELLTRITTALNDASRTPLVPPEASAVVCELPSPVRLVRPARSAR